MRAIWLGFAFLSGTSALCYEVVWTRLLSLRLGTTTAALTAVLASFMLGLAIGSWIFGRIADKIKHPIILYALLETGICISALIIPHAISSLPPGPERTFPLRFSFAPLIIFLSTAAILIPPTVFMGGVLPALLAASGRHRASTNISPFYAINTMGGVAGVLIATFVGFTTIGIAAVNITAAAVNFTLAISAILISSIVKSETTPIQTKQEDSKPIEQTDIKSPTRHLLATAACVSGLAVVGMEICWSRAMVFVLFGRNIYVVTIMLATVLIGLTIGSALAGPASKKWNRKTLLGTCLVGTAAASTVSLASIMTMPKVVASFGYGSWIMVTLGEALAAALVILPATIFPGMALPIAAAIETDRKGKIAGFGDIYAANTIGSVLGPVLATYAAIPHVGIRTTAAIFAGLCWIVGTLFFDHKKLVPAIALVIASIGFIPTYGHYVYGIYARQEEGSKLLYVREGVGATVTVMSVPDLTGIGRFRILDIDATNVAGTNRELITIQKLQAHLPLLLHGSVRNVLHIGFGSGGTCYSASLHGMPRLDAVEISPEVLQAADRFPDTNHGVLSNPRLHVFVDDARSYLESTNQRYDAILSDSIHPQILGNAWLYSEDYFKLCKSRLKPNGVISFWLPIYSLSEEDLKIILRTFQKVFPNVYVFYPNVVRSPFTIAMAFNGSSNIDTKRIEKGLKNKAVMEDLGEIDIRSTRDIMSFLIFTPENVRKLCGTGIINTDDKPVLELSAPKAMDRMKTWEQNFAMLLDSRIHKAEPPVENLLAAQRNQLAYQSAEVFRLYDAARADAWNDYPERQAVQYALEAGDAVETLETMVAESPDNIWLRTLLARVYLRNKNPESALEILSPIAQNNNPLEPQDAILLSAAYISNGQTDKAEKTLKRAKQITADVLAAYAGIAYRCGDIEKSIKLYKDALAINPSRSDIRLYLADALAESNRLAEAAKEYESVVTERPADTHALKNYAAVLEKLGRRKESKRILAQVELIGG